MPDIPRVAAANPKKQLIVTVKASQAVKTGIATHAMKHVAQRRKLHADVEEAQKLKGKSE
jgi:hypothetical protein